MPLTVGALFAGYGGLELGVSQVLDVTTSWVAEFDKAPSRILAQRFPGVPNLGDVTAVDWAAVDPVDIITGGSPCQDLSSAGKRAGMRPGTRSGLWASMCDAVDIIRPRLVLWENVRGALSASATTGHLERCDLCMGNGSDDTMRALGRVLGDLAELGYDAAWCGLRAADVGAPHGRYRIFVLAWPADSARLGLGWRGPARDGWPESPDGDSGDVNDLELLPTPAVNDMGGNKTVEWWDEFAARTAAKHHNGNGHGKSLAIEMQRLLPTPVVNDMGEGKTLEWWEDWKERGRWNDSGGDSLAIQAQRLLPTPKATNNENRQSADRYGPNLGEALFTLLPTPRATDGTHGGPNQRGTSGDLMLPSAVLLPTPDVSSGLRSAEGHERGDHQVSLQDLPHLLPTPSAADAAGGHKTRSGDRSGELLLGGLAPTLMPTPTAVTRDRTEGEIQHRRETRHTGLNLDEVRTVEFGAYAPAVARWEAVLGRPAPAPTRPDGRDSAHRLSAPFVEWLMGLPAGWVTDTGLSRNEQLKALGNGVVPHQAGAALRHLLRLRATLAAQEATA